MGQQRSLSCGDLPTVSVGLETSLEAAKVEAKSAISPEVGPPKPEDFVEAGDGGRPEGRALIKQWWGTTKIL
jgi:hypothetical protein